MKSCWKAHDVSIGTYDGSYTVAIFTHRLMDGLFFLFLKVHVKWNSIVYYALSCFIFCGILKYTGQTEDKSIF